MKIYDALMDNFRQLTEGFAPDSYTYDAKKLWPKLAEYELILQRDVAFELGGGGKASTNFTCVTTKAEYFDGDQVLVYGPKLQDIDRPVSFARIAEVLVKEEASQRDTEKLYKLVQDIDFVKYHVYPAGYMMRTSGQSCREQVRISKKAIQERISFEHIGNTFIHHYKQNPNVLSVRVTFITTDSIDFEELKKLANTATDIKNSLSKISKGMPTECSSCGIREICNEVEGLKELHFGKKSPITQAFGRIKI